MYDPDRLKLRTVIGPVSLPLALDHSKGFLTIGSCFADSIGDQLKASKFSVSVNPTGTLYDPLSVFRILSTACSPVAADERLFTERDGRWYSHDWHSSLNAGSQEELKYTIDERLTGINKDLVTTGVLLITLGTAWVYRHLNSGKDVANCHKVPAKLFERRLLSVEEMMDAFTLMYRELRSSRPDLQLILTVSPVRHLSDTLPLNNLSKSLLRVACHRLCELEGVHYFPAFEIMNDDLRDYRFYEDDLIHPTPLAVGYIWQKFLEAAFTTGARELVGKWEQIRRSLAHRPWNPSSPGHQAFLQKLLTDLHELRNRIDVEEEIKTVTAAISQ